MRTPRFLTAAIAAVTTIAITASVAPGAVAAPAGAPDNAPKVQQERSVPLRPAAISPLSRAGMAAAGAVPASWPAAGKSEVDVPAGGLAAQRAATAPVLVGRPVRQRLAAPEPAAKVSVETFDQATAKKSRVAGVMLRLADAGGAAGQTMAVTVDYTGFAAAYGGDYGSRLRLTEYPACLLTTPEKAECHAGKPVVSQNNPRTRKLSGNVALAPEARSGTLLVAEAGNAGSGGNYGATDLASSGSWSAGGSSGEFSYSVPLGMPAAPGGLIPQLGFGYSSASVDGRTSATNSQASWAGDGWDISAGGFIERRYTPCSEDTGGNQGSTLTGDLCWKGEHYTVSLGGASGKLIKDTASGQWRPEHDDGSRIQKLDQAGNGALNGEYWKVTGPDGSQYFLGLNRLPGWTSGRPETRSVFTEPVFGNHPGEPCNQAAFVNSSCTQAYRWNVDLVIDPRGNAMTYYYNQEINYYKRGGLQGTNTAYVAAGNLDRIEFGLRGDAPYSPAPAKVVFQTADRCQPADGLACDVPFDRGCAAGEDCTSRYSPAFFSRIRLTRVLTQSLSGGSYRDVDAWALRQSFPPTGDGLPRSLWLDGVTRTGYVGGTVTLPERVFTGIPMDNRVDAIDNFLPLTRYRITSILGEAGAVTEVRYADRDCVRGSRMPANAESNTYRCYPSWWSPEGATAPVLDWFHKYVATEVIEDSRTGGPSVSRTRYEFLGGGAWHFDSNDEADDADRTWSEWRGYEKVRKITGNSGTPQTITETLYLRGMDGDRLPGGAVRDVWVTDSEGGRVEDDERLTGFVRETLLHSGGQIVSASLSEPQVIQTGSDGTDTANMVRTRSQGTRSLQENGGWRRTRATTTYTSIGLPEAVDDEGDIGVTGDESCTRTTYLRNDAAWLLVYASQVRSIAKPCGVWPGTAADVTSDVLSAYDNQPAGTAPTRGVVTESKRWTSATTYQLVSTTKTDQYGRVIETTDDDGAKTTTTYTPATGNPTTVGTVNRAGWTTTSTLDTARGLSLTEIGINGERADVEYDPLGRTVKVWAPGRSKPDGKTPTTEYSYDYRTDAPTVVTTRSIKENESYAVSYDLYDGLLRPRQTQSPALGGGRIVTDTFYDSRGNAFKSNGAYYNAGAPSNALQGVLDQNVPNQTVIEYDDLGRPRETILKRNGDELWRTKTRYGGDTTYTTPPQGDVATAVLKDAKGRIVERRQYNARSADGTYPPGAGHDAMTYSYNAKGALAKVVDAAGNQWTYEYDLLGRKSADVDPDRGRTTYGYDTRDQLVSTTDARGKTLAYTYDDLGRKTGMYDGSVTGTKLADWTYDTLRKGLPTSSTRYSGGNAYVQRVDAYDVLGRPTFTSVVIPAVEGKLAGTYTYGAGYSAVTGQLLSETMPAAGGLVAENVVHTYNDLGLPDATYGLNTYASEHQYSPYGETLRVTLGVSPNKVWVSTGYEEGTRRLATAEVRRDTTTQPQVTNRAFSYDPAGNLTKLADTPADSPADTQCFGYDHLRRMNSAWTPRLGDCAAAKSVAALGGAAPYWYDFTFDKIGNRTKQVQHTASGDITENYTVPAPGPTAVRPHSVTSVNRTGPTGTAVDQYTYDNTGNTLTRKLGGNTQTLEWSAEGRAAKVTEANGAKSEYLYDASGSRLIKREPTATTLYLPGQELVLATGAAAPSGKRYYSHGGATVAMRSSVNGLTYLTGDHHGTDDVSITASNLFVARRYSDPFGNSRGTAPRFWPDDKGFVGGTKDSSGLTSVGAREYDSRTGRFVSVDPIIDFGDPQQAHGYSYGNNAPATYSDSTGEYQCADEGCRFRESSQQPWTEEKQQKLNAYQDRVNGINTVVKESQDKACAEMGMSGSACKQVQDDAASTKGFWDVVKAELPDIVGDLTGFNDLRDCFVNFDLWACVGIIPWGRVLKLVKTAGKIFDVVRKALAWEDRVSSARAKLHKLQSRTDSLVREGMDKLNDLLEKARKQTPSSCKLHSFPPGTRVLLADGSSKPIEEVTLGDVVSATDPTTGRTEPHPVVATWTHDNEPQRTELTIDPDGPAGPVTLTATDWHPVWAPDLKAWVPIGNLQTGAWLQTSAGTRVQVTAVRHYTGTGKVHDLTIDEIHSYHVLAGPASVLVHNCDGGPINTSPGGIEHTNQRHFSTGKQSAGKSLFNDSEMPHQLAAQAQGTPFAFRQGSGRIQHVVPDAGRNVGVDRASGSATRTYTVVTEANGDMVTMFPGLPQNLGAPIRCTC